MRTMTITLVGALGLIALIAFACGGDRTVESEEPAAANEEPPSEVKSLFGKPLTPMELDDEQRSELESNLNEARAVYDRNPEDPEAIIWLGRRLAYLWRYREAIDVFTKGIELHPENHKLYRHRGHRYITVREFDKAIADLEKASMLIEGIPDEVEPDGAPNPTGIPRSSSHTNIFYHLGLGYYLTGRFEDALAAYRKGLELCDNDDMRVATLDWMYMSYRRLGRDAEAKQLLESVAEEMDILESFSYHKRLLMYKGLVEPDRLLDPTDATELDLATQGYGVANWYLVQGDEAKAKELFARILEGRYWAAFGYIAAEADLERMGG